MFQMRPKYDILLRGTPQVPAGLYQLQLLTARQLTTLHYRPGTLKTVKARLKTLSENGYVQSDVVPSRRMRTPYYYVLDKGGAKYLEDAGCDVSESWRPSREVGQNALFVEHTLELNDVLISALLLHTCSTYRLERFVHERVLKRSPYKADHITLIPDAFLSFRYNDRRMPVLLEHDRGTEEQFYFRRRIRAYLSFLRSGGYREMFGTSTITIAFTTFVGGARVEQMRSWARAELKDTDFGSVFCFANLTRPLDPASVWLSPNWLSVDDKPPEVLLAA